jgi:hypothetical protein
LAFGNQAVGTTSPAKTVTVTNNQTTTLNFSFAASGNYSAVGSGSSPCTASLGAKKTCTLSVTFTPTANGAINGAVTFTDTTIVKQQEVTLSGTGTGGAAAPLTFSPASLTFTSQAFNSSSPAQTVTMKNTGASSATISSLAASGNYTVAGSGSTPCQAGSVLANNGSCTMSVTFAPTYLGTIKGAVVVTDNAAVNQQVLNVTGTGVLPVVFSPTSLTFAAQTVGTTSMPQGVTMTNNLAASLTKIAIAASGDFAISANNCSATLASKTQCTFAVTFTPSQTGSIKGAVTVIDSALGSPQVVNLGGTGQ